MALNNKTVSQQIYKPCCINGYNRQVSETSNQVLVHSCPQYGARNSNGLRSGTKVAILLCMVCFVVTVGAVVTTMVMLNKLGALSADRGSRLFCVPCDSLSSATAHAQRLHGVEPVRRMETRNGRNVEVCCAKENTILDSLLEKELATQPPEEYFDEHVPGLTGNSGRPGGRPDKHVPAAHLVLTKKHTADKGRDELYPVHGWSHKGHSMVVKQHIRYANSRLIIGKKGLYYVYSQVRFLERPYTRDANYRALSLSHYVYKYNRYLANGGERQLLRNSRSRCEDKNSYLEQTSYLGAVLKLEEGDQIFVKVNNLTSLQAEPRSTYFGLYYIGT